ncbi:MAG: hypothetical protein KQA41_02720 [Candidatus Aenigmarchaeota archaeon]|nr:hypothetical protein [Candidatus Aenigmarchaeota archaeon]MBU5689113.1 hypothetical protein [Candidatus Aenigmarchaeota archaeon]
MKLNKLIIFFVFVFLVLLSLYLFLPKRVNESKTVTLDDNDLKELNLSIANECITEKYQAQQHSSLSEYTYCNYTADNLKDTWIFVEIKKFTNLNDLENSYQYESSHLFGSKGLLSENEFGDKSKFRVNAEDDYGAEFNPPGIYYYHLWITKGYYMIHITSKGSMDADKTIKDMGQRILLKIQ